MLDIVIVSGGFDPIHPGHIALLKNAAMQGKTLVVGLNSDDWLTRKKGRPFMKFEDRRAIIEALECVDYVYGFDDSDNTANELLLSVHREHLGKKIAFANGGDRVEGNVPEEDMAKRLNIELLWNIGGRVKTHASSDLLEEYKAPHINRKWGYYIDHHRQGEYVFKTLVIEPGKHISYQRHYKRSEFWVLISGHVAVLLNDNTIKTKVPFHTFIVEKEMWHQIHNLSNEQPAVIAEIQYGDCWEEDIERRDEMSEEEKIEREKFPFLSRHESSGN